MSNKEIFNIRETIEKQNNHLDRTLKEIGWIEIKQGEYKRLKRDDPKNCNNYTAKTQMNKGYTPKYLSKEDIIEFARELHYEDFCEMKRFVNIFQKSLGEISGENLFTRRQGFLPLFDIYYRNLRKEKDDIIITRFHDYLKDLRDRLRLKKVSDIDIEAKFRKEFEQLCCSLEN